jgi:hypothetical protein
LLLAIVRGVPDEDQKPVLHGTVNHVQGAARPTVPDGDQRIGLLSHLTIADETRAPAKHPPVRGIPLKSNRMATRPGLSLPINSRGSSTEDGIRGKSRGVHRLVNEISTDVARSCDDYTH